MSVYESRIEIGEVEDVLVRVHYTPVQFCSGSTDGRYGPKIEPDEPAHIEIDRIEVVGQERDIELTAAQEDRIESEINDYLSSNDG